MTCVINLLHSSFTIPHSSLISSEMSVADTSFPLSREESRLLAERLAILVSAGLPLASGLRAAAEEMPSRRLAAAMTNIAERLETARSLDDALRTSPRLMPEHMLRLVETGVRSGNLAAVLSELIEMERASFALRRSVLSAISYPILLTAICVAILVLLVIYVVPDMRRAADDFGTRIPYSTQLLFSLSQINSMQLAGAILAGVTMLLFGLRVSLPPQRWRWALTRLPLFGPMLLWRGIADWARLASLLVRQGIPLPEALRLAATGVNDALMAVEGLRLARITKQGWSVAEAIESTDTLPETITPLLRWGERCGNLPQGFQTVAEMFENRLRLRVALIRSILPPVAFITVAIGALWLTNAMFGAVVGFVFPSISGLGRKVQRAEASYDFGYVATMLLAAIVAVVILLGLFRFAIGFIMSPARKRPIARQIGAFSRKLLWLAFFVALFIALYELTMVEVACLIGSVVFMIALTTAYQRRQSERQAFYWLLGTAIDRGISLPAAMHAYGNEHNHALSKRVRRFAQQLELGRPLDVAISVARVPIPTDARVAARTAYVTSDTTPVAKSTRNSESIAVTLHQAASKLLYAVVLTLFTTFGVAFLWIRILPAYVKILHDFNLSLPATTAFLAAFSNWVRDNGLLFALGPLVVIAAGYFVLRNSGIKLTELWGVRSITRPRDTSVVLQSLANAVRYHTPITTMIDSLAQQYPKPYIQMRLSDVARRTRAGMNWCDSLCVNGFLSESESSLLKAAERVGNLGWALNDMADRLVRQFIARINHILSVGLPVLLFVFGAIILTIALAILEPLVNIISDLTLQTYS